MIFDRHEVDRLGKEELDEITKVKTFDLMSKEWKEVTEINLLRMHPSCFLIEN